MQLTDVWGKPAASGAAALQPISLKIGGKRVLSDVGAAWEAGSFTFDLSDASKAPGLAE